jgi:hypothetical protein
MDGIDANPVARCCTFHCDRFCEQPHSSFGGAVAGQTGRSPEAGHRRHDDDRAAAGGRIAGTACLIDRNTPSRFSAVCRRQSANGISTALHKMPIPALATITSRRPKRSSGGFDYCRPALVDTYVLVKKDRFAPRRQSSPPPPDLRHLPSRL